MKKHLFLVWWMAACMLGLTGCKAKDKSNVTDTDPLQNIQLPSSRISELKLLKTWSFNAPLMLRADYLYISGGIDNIDKGSVDWGTTEPKKFRMIGDYAGELRIFYDNDRVDTVPLVYGYTLWYKNNWKQGKEPFAVR